MARSRTIAAPDGDPGPAARGRSSSARLASSPTRSPSTCRSSSPRRRGAVVTDVDGNTFLDFTGGVGCLNVGHSHPRVVAAAAEQLARFTHTDFTIVPYESYVALAERLVASRRSPGRCGRRSSTPARRPSRTPSRSRALATGRPAVIAFDGGFHGRTLMAMTLTSKTHPYKAGFGPVRARGLPRAVREPVPRAGRGEALAELERAF